MLVERDAELERLERALDGAGAGAGELLAIAGPAGIGKSSLLAAVRARAGRRGLRVLSASGSELERAFPLGVCRQLFEPALTRAAPGERETLLDGPAEIAGRLLLAAPPPARVEGGAPGRDGGLLGEQPDAYAALHGLYWLAANLAERRPLAVVVDDAHWSDAPSLRLLSYVARRLDGLAATFVIAARETEDELLQAVLCAPEVRVLRPGSLSAPASAVLIREALGAEPAEEFGAACRQATGGNPFYLSELLQSLASAGVAPTARNARRVTHIGPPAISRDVLGRVARLGSGCLALVRALAVLGRSADLSVAAQLAGLDQREASAAADALFGAAILGSGLPATFSHPIVQAAVYEDIPPLERARAHRRAAALLAARSAGTPEIAVHLLHTQPGRDRWTLAQVREAAKLALAGGAAHTAIDYLRRALSESPSTAERFAILLTLGTVLAGQGDPEGVAVLHAAEACAPGKVGRAQVAVPLATALVYAGRAEEGIGTLERALAGLDGSSPAMATQLEALLWVMAITDVDARGRVRERLDRTLERFRRDPGAIAESVLPPLAIELIFSGAGAAQAAGVAERALRVGELVRREPTYSPLPSVAAYALIATGEAGLAERALDEAAERARREGGRGGLGVVLATRSLARLRQGDLRGAQADAELYVRLSLGQRPEVVAPIALRSLVAAHVERGELEEARDVLRLPVVAECDPTGVLTQPLVECRARLCVAAGDPAGAIRELERCRDWADAWGEASGCWPVQWRQALALAELRRGNAPRARQLAADDVELARRFGAARPLGRSLVALGLSVGGAAGIRRLREAADVLDGSEDRLEHARALVELGGALRRAGERTAAREPLADGLKGARACGATALARRAYEELRVTGARPRKILASGPEALTPSELRVARMAAEGMTNREIAHSLYVTRKTVEVHLGHAYQKLDIASRTELASALR